MEWVPVAAGVGSILTSAKSLFGGGGGGDMPAPPAIPKPTVMPTPDDEAVRAQKRRQLSALSQRRGRQSTILSEPTSSDLLG